MDLCLDVVYNSDMKAIGLHNLVLAYIEWEKQQQAEPQEAE